MAKLNQYAVLKNYATKQFGMHQRQLQELSAKTGLLDHEIITRTQKGICAALTTYRLIDALKGFKDSYFRFC
jgi:hypothetical protein